MKTNIKIRTLDSSGDSIEHFTDLKTANKTLQKKSNKYLAYDAKTSAIISKIVKGTQEVILTRKISGG